MQAAMLRLDALLRRRRHIVLAVWVALLAAAVPFALQQSEHLTGGGFAVPGSQSKAVEDAIGRDFGPAAHGTTLAGVVVPGRGATPAGVRHTVDELGAAAGRVDGVSLAPAARAAALRQAAAHPSRPVIVPLATTVDEFDASNVAKDLRDDLGLKDRTSPVGLHLVGQGALWAGMQDLSKSDLESAEATGFPIVLLILLAVFGSLAAAALPLALGFVSVLVTGGVIFWLSQAMHMSVFVTNMASMIGIGVAVDYSLFVLARYREEIAAGHSPDRARAIAMATSGVAVLFSGATVVVSLAGLFMLRTTALQSMAFGAIIVVLVSMLASATLLPVLIRLLGDRVHERGRVVSLLYLAVRNRRPRRPGSTHPDAPRRRPVFERWADVVMRRPLLALVAAAGLLVLLAIPALGLKTGDGALRQFPKGNETRAGFEAAASVTGPGASSPVKVLVARDGAARAARILRADREVARVTGPLPARSGDKVLLAAQPRHDGESTQAKALVGRLRAQLGPGVLVGGNSASLRDFDHSTSGSMWKIVLFVVALSYLVLMVLLRSVVLPLKAVVANLLSVGAAYGVLTIVFVWGWFDGFLGFHSQGYVDTITPPLVLAVVFGLSMDYEVFLLSRIRERFNATGDTRRAVGEGLATSARTITSAALIMVAVFAVFVGTGVPSIKQLGLGNAAAIAVDATVVRLVLVPAAMELLGRWCWWIPRGLARVLPRAGVEELPAGAR
jgi:RND superfamily putative drug exporter